MVNPDPSAQQSGQAASVALFQVKNPEPFNFSSPSEWPKWRKRFERFRIASGLNTKGEEEQVNMLIYLMGDQADDILLSFQLSADDQKKYKAVIDKFEGHFVLRRNVIYERAKFNSRVQREGETVDDFITALYSLAEHCEYKTLHDEMIRDRIVVGVRDRRLSEKLQLDNSLTLEKAIGSARQSEAVKREQQELHGEEQKPQIDRVGSSSSSQQKTHLSTKFEGKCHWCGSTKRHDKSECPAKNSECHNCKKTGHYAKVCKSKFGKSVNEVIADGGVSPGFLGSVSQNSPARQKRWTADVQVDNKIIHFKLDSGADVSVIPEQLFRTLYKCKMQPADRSLMGPDGNKLKTVGMFIPRMKYRSETICEPVFIVRGLDRPLLGLSACEELKLVQRIHSLKEQKFAVSDVLPKSEFPKLFKGLGKLDKPYDIKVKDEAEPFAIYTPRRIPIPLMDKLKEQLASMEKDGVIEKVEGPTDWCAPLVIAPKANGGIRICVDLSELNKNVKREVHPMPAVEHTLGQLAGAKVFSKLDANSGFWQITLTESSCRLTTFITPFGRYCYKRLPFGITSAPEVFQKRMSEILDGLDGLVLHLDDILVWGKTKEEHNARLRQVLERLAKAGITLNDGKCQFGVNKVIFLGHELDEKGIRADKSKVEAINRMPAPTNVTEVRRFIGMGTQLGRFVPRLSEILQPLNDLLKNENDFIWESAQQKSFNEVKRVLTERPCLTLFDPTKKTVVSADASSYGLGAVLRQEKDGVLLPVAYASRTLSDAEKRYAQIEKEALATTWACERFRDFLTGLEFFIETDHKPLVPIFTSKNLDDLTPRLQRLKLRMMRYSYSIFHTPGKDIITADVLSRAPLDEKGDGELEREISAHVHHVVSCIPASDEKLAEIFREQQSDPVLQTIAKYSETAWPERKNLDIMCSEYWSVRDEIAVEDGLLMRGCRLIIPTKMRTDILERIHGGHQGITKCRMRARESVWWPGISTQIEEMIKRCQVCIPEATVRHEPLRPSEFPERPWQKVGMDLLHCDGYWYLLVTDYFSRYPEIARLSKDLSAEAVITHCKSIFARHGVPETVISDNGPQFMRVNTSKFTAFAKEYGFNHITSSPRYPQSNGFAEAGVKIIKMTLKKNVDVYKALMEYRATPLFNGYSPAELLMGRKLRTTLPQSPSNLKPKAVNLETLTEKEEHRRTQQKRNYDPHHGVQQKEDFEEGEKVWITDQRVWGTSRKKADTPRSYMVETPLGEVRRNSYNLVRAYVKEEPIQIEIDPPEEDPGSNVEDTRNMDEPSSVPEPTTNTSLSAGPYKTRYGRVIRRPIRYMD
jgi:transposase InsO family protein